ncbi:MAG: hypothetical protein Q4F50_12780 [Bacteroides sp.]|uniref:hypothetical protein n=1 Tax=Bacteroides sp. TaxID=29523 RepID=UPI0026DFB0C5|nr:hypothetical protein [Bacteroides sp.]MDO5420921.1 hypothetical protein [Bacteroides sp.]
MGNWNKQLEEKQESKEKDKVRKEKLAGYFFNLSQLSFVSLVIGLIITMTKEELYENYFLMILVFFGILLTLLFARIGNNLLK